MSENSNKNQKKCPQCGFHRNTDSFADKKICHHCVKKNKLASSSLFGRHQSTDEDDGSSGDGARKLELKHTRDVETLANEIELDNEAHALDENLEKKDKEKRFLSKQKTFIEQQERTLLASEETLDEEKSADQTPIPESEPEKQEREKTPNPDDGPSDSPLKNSAKFRQIQKDQLGFFENKRQMDTKNTNQKQKVSQFYRAQQKSETGKLISEETKKALSVAFRRWR